MSDTMTEAKSVPHNDVEKKSLQEDTQTSDDSNKDNDNDNNTDDDYPDGGLKAWLVAAGAAGIFFCTMGYANSFGVFQAYYMYHQLPEHSADEISWIGSIQTFCMLAMGAVGGPLFDRYGAWVVRPAAAAFVVSVMLTSLCTRYWHFMLAQGVLTGLANGLAIYPALAAVPHWFLRRRAAAMGAAVAGSSLGAIAQPLALSGMLNSTGLGFGWSVRIVGLAMLPVLAFALLTLRARLPPRRARFFLPAAFGQPVYVLLVAATAVGMIGMFVPLFLIPAYAMSRGVDAALAGNLVAVLNAASVFGRVIPGVLADRFGRINMMLAAGATTGLLCFCWPQATSTPGIAVFSVVIGFCSGAILSGASAALAACADDPRSIGTYMGMGMALSCVSALIGPPVSGKLIDTYGRYDECAYFSGAMSLLCAILVAIAKSRTPAGLFGNA